MVAGSCHGAVCEGKKHPGITAIYLTESVKPESAAEEWVSAFRDRLRKSDPYCIVPDKDKAVAALQKEMRELKRLRMI